MLITGPKTTRSDRPYRQVLKSSGKVSLHRKCNGSLSSSAISDFKAVLHVLEESEGDSTTKRFFGHTQVGNTIFNHIMEVVAIVMITKLDIKLKTHKYLETSDPIKLGVIKNILLGIKICYNFIAY